jgi:predicted ATP-dependent protease
MDWRKSTYSEGNGGSCIETASANGVISVRDTADRDGGTLAFSADAWREFTRRLRRYSGRRSVLTTVSATIYM